MALCIENTKVDSERDFSFHSVCCRLILWRMPMEEIISRLLLSIIKCKIGMLIVLSSFCPSFLAKCIPIKNVTVDFSSNSSLTGESTVVQGDSPAEPEDSSKFAHKVFVVHFPVGK